jgi:hypothetical protein
MRGAVFDGRPGVRMSGAGEPPPVRPTAPAMPAVPAAPRPAAGGAQLAEPAARGVGAGVAGIVDRCAAAARRRRDQMYGTAAPVSRWLLIEHAGPWGRNALRESTLDAAVADTLVARAAASRVRVVLIRRRGRGAQTTRRRVGWVDSRPGREGLWWGSWAHQRDLLDVLPDQPAGAPSTEPVYLVCAHGRHDACCAIWGRPIAAVLADLRPDAVWECSHVGGDRFAANVIALPHGLYYGEVTAEDVPDLVAGYEAGLVRPDLLRGRSSLPAVVQAAQHYARLELADYRLDALAPLRVEPTVPATWRVLLEHPAGPVTVTVRADRGPAIRLTCSSARPESPRVFQLLELQLPMSAGHV